MFALGASGVSEVLLTGYESIDLTRECLVRAVCPLGLRMYLLCVTSSARGMLQTDRDKVPSELDQLLRVRRD